MSEFLDKFKGKSNKMGKQGLIQLSHNNYQSSSISIENKSNIIPSAILLRSRSNQVIKNSPKVQCIQLPRIKSIPDKNFRSNKSQTQQRQLPTLARTKLLQFIRQKQKQIKNSLINSPYNLKRDTSNQGHKISPFDVPKQKGYAVAMDEMRFLKSFQKYKNISHISIHRKMSQRCGTKQSSPDIGLQSN